MTVRLKDSGGIVVSAAAQALRLDAQGSGSSAHAFNAVDVKVGESGKGVWDIFEGGRASMRDLTLAVRQVR